MRPLSLLPLALLAGCQWLERTAVQALDQPPPAPEGALTATFDGADATREQVSVSLVPVADGLPRITDVQFPPGRSDTAVVLGKKGQARVVDLATGETTPWFQVDVVTVSEQGLLGLAFHPDFADNGRFWTHTTPAGASPEVSRITAWHAPEGLDGPPKPIGTALEVEQPYQNHNAGQIAFGPDGYLYIGLGDGGLRADPTRAGQDPTRLLGSLLRIDVGEGATYTTPDDNPTWPGEGARREIYAIGTRNPWRFSWDPQGRLIVADVGQDAWEEISIVPGPGVNLGWRPREGRHCFPPGKDCTSEGFHDPIYEYGHDEGRSITGGFVATGDAAPGLQGRYVFGDFSTGRLWAIPLPDDAQAIVERPIALGRWPILPSTFGRDAAGDLYVGDYGKGVLYRIIGGDPSKG